MHISNKSRAVISAALFHYKKFTLNNIRLLTHGHYPSHADGPTQLIRDEEAILRDIQTAMEEMRSFKC